MTRIISTGGTDDLEWIKSSYSTAAGAECVEVARTPEAVHVRDSKDKDGPHLTFTPDAWQAFVTYAAHLD